MGARRIRARSAGAVAHRTRAPQLLNAPVGVNFLIASYAYTRGGLAFDPSLPIENEHLTTSVGFAYARALDL